MATDLVWNWRVIVSTMNLVGEDGHRSSLELEGRVLLSEGLRGVAKVVHQ